MAGKIERVVLIVKENHTFDNYFGTFPGADGAQLSPAQNPPPDDPDHTHQAWMDRADDTAHRVQYGEADIGGYFDLARRFTLCDNYFSEVAGPSTPNHLMLICADAPVINNPRREYRPRTAERYRLPSLPAALETAGLSWGNYGGYAFAYIEGLDTHTHNHGRDQFAVDAREQRLPAVSWVYGDGHPNLSEHPKQNVTDGMTWTIDQISAIVEGGLWDTTAILITWDDWGGWYDHVQPPVVETWDHRHAQRSDDELPQYDGQPFRYGSRVGCMAVGSVRQAGPYQPRTQLAREPAQVLRKQLRTRRAHRPRCRFQRHERLHRPLAAAQPGPITDIGWVATRKSVIAAGTAALALGLAGSVVVHRAQPATS